MHGFRGQQGRELDDESPLRPDRAQFELLAARDHVVEHGIDRELIFAGPFGDSSRTLVRLRRMNDAAVSAWRCFGSAENSRSRSRS